MADDQQTPVPASPAPVSYPASATAVVGNRVVRDVATATATNARRMVPKHSSRTHPTPKGR